MRKPFDLSSLKQSTLWSEASLDPASRSASPGSKKGPKTKGTSGPKCHESSAKSDPAGYSLRTFLACELSRLTSSLKTWKDRGTPAGRSWWVLMTSAPRTVAKGCGLSEGSDWPTPTQTPYGSNGDAPGELGPRRPSLDRSVRMWPTATAGDANALSWETPQTAQRKSRKALTASTENGRRSGGGNSSTPGLEQQAELSEGIMPPEMEGTPLAPMAARFAGLLAPESPSTNGKPQDWPTPTAHDGRSPGVDIHSTQGGNLSRDVALWRTPSASLIDPKPEGTKLTGRTPQDPQIGIADQVMATEWPTPRANRHGAPDSHGKAPIRGSLNPRWVAQLMGFPTDWLDSPPPTGGKR